MIQLGVLG
ncbi:hypothetical protein VCHC32A1_0079, partial [Vibrio cholerae HC-32A1]